MAQNQIVVDYKGREELVLLSMFDLNGGAEMQKEEVDREAQKLSLTRPKTYDFGDISEVVQMAKTLPKDDEGFVVQFQSGTRVKVKGDEYCRIHKLLAHHSPIAVWECYRDKGIDFVKEYKLQIPEEFWDEVDEWVSHFQEQATKIGLQLIDIDDYTFMKSDKELGLELPNLKLPVHPPKEISKEIRGLVFSFRKNRSSFWDLGSKTRKKAFDIFRPTGNVMPTKETK